MEHSRLVSALRLPDGMFSENAGTEVGSDLLILQKETGKGVQNEWEQLFTQSVSIESGGESFTENALFAEGNHAVATAYRIGTDAYGKPAPIYTHEGGIEGIARDLEARISADMAARFDRKIYRSGLSENVLQVASPEKKISSSAEKKSKREKQTEQEEASEAYDLMPKALARGLPKLYASEKQLIGDRTAYARYFFPMGAYTAYLLEYDPKERIGFGAVTMGYGWELGYMSFDEMAEVKIGGLGIERDLYFSPTKLHEIKELSEIVGEQYTRTVEPIAKETSSFTNEATAETPPHPLQYPRCPRRVGHAPPCHNAVLPYRIQ